MHSGLLAVTGFTWGAIRALGVGVSGPVVTVRQPTARTGESFGGSRALLQVDVGPFPREHGMLSVDPVRRRVGHTRRSAAVRDGSVSLLGGWELAPVLGGIGALWGAAASVVASYGALREGLSSASFVAKWQWAERRVSRGFAKTTRERGCAVRRCEAAKPSRMGCWCGKGLNATETLGKRGSDDVSERTVVQVLLDWCSDDGVEGVGGDADVLRGDDLVRLVRQRVA